MASVQIEITKKADLDDCLTSSPPTENDDVRDKSIRKDTFNDDGDVIARKIISPQKGLTTGSTSSSENTMKNFSKSSHETHRSSEINFLCKPFMFLRRRYGLVLASLGTILFSIQGLLVDVQTETLDSFQVVFMYSPILMIFCLVLIIFKGVRPSRNYKHYFWLLGSGTCQAGNTCLLALSMTYLAVGDTVTIMYTALIQVGFFSWFILKEPLRLFDIVFVILAFGGVIFIARPPFIFRTEASTPAYDNSLLGVFYALAASCAFALHSVINRKLSKLGADSFFCIFFNATTVVFLSGLMSVILNKLRCPTMHEYIFALLSNGIYTFAHITFFYALKVETATLVTVIATIEIVCAYLWQVIFLGLPPFWTSYVGAILIFAACIGITLKNKQVPTATDPLEVMDAEHYRPV